MQSPRDGGGAQSLARRRSGCCGRRCSARTLEAEGWPTPTGGRQPRGRARTACLPGREMKGREKGTSEGLQGIDGRWRAGKGRRPTRRRRQGELETESRSRASCKAPQYRTAKSASSEAQIRLLSEAASNLGRRWKDAEVDICIVCQAKSSVKESKASGEPQVGLTFSVSRHFSSVSTSLLQNTEFKACFIKT